MAEDFAIGRALVIPQSVMNNLNKIDEKINLIASDSEKMATHFTSAMTRMDGSAGDLIKKLQSIQGLVGSIGNINIKGLDTASTSMGKTATEAERVASNVTQAATAINRMGSGLNIAELTTRIKELNDQLIKGGGVQTVSEQQAIVNEKRLLEEELKFQKQSDNEKQKIREKSLEQELKRSDRELAAIKKLEDERVKSAQREYQAKAKLDSQLRKSNYQSYVTSTEGSLRTADKANTYAQRAQAIRNLEEAIKKLRTTDANYQKDLQRLSDAHKRLSNEQKKVEANFKSIQSSQRRLMDTSGQLERKLALVFSVSQIEGYISKLVRVRGEFELQNTALASILQNKDQADRLFAQITELAVQSPFTLKELTTYTKSLSAYSVEYEKLYDTTKMLADVSAGLGVDMQRLILAFGQVKAANFLRGTETRQFTEAGINMLGELAKYYSELEGRIVSVTEVQDRQFKRMISFQDVEQVFKRLTSAGGMFYNMQERQAETLAGMMSNLQDRIDLMLNSIGKENEGVIKGVIKILANLIENYEAVANAIEAIGVSFLAYKGYLLLANKELIRFASLSGIATSSAAKQLTVSQLLQVGFLKLSKSIKAAGTAMKSFAANNIYLLAITAIVSAIYEAIHWNDEYNEQLDNINKKHSETSANLNKIATEYESISKKAREAANAQEEFAYSGDTYKELYSQLSKLNEELKNRGYTLPIQLEFVNPENIDEAFKGGKELLDYANEFSTEFKKALATETNATEGWFGIFGDNLSTDLKQLSDSYSEVGSAFKANLDIVENEVINISSKLTGAARDYYNELQKGKKEEESNTEWTLRRLELLQKINQATTYWGKNRRFNSILESNEILNDLYRQRVSISNKEKEVQYGLDKVLNSLIEKYGSLENLKKAVNDNPVIIKTEIDRVFEEMELGEQAKRFASFWASQRLKIPVEFTTPKELPTFYGDFRDTVKTIDTSGIFDKQLESMTSLVDLEEALQKKYQEVSKQQEVLNRANTERLDLTKQIAAEQEKLLSADADEANAARLKIENLENQRSVIDKTISDAKEANSEVIKIIKSIAEAFNLSYVSQKTTTKKDTQLQRLKGQIALIKKAGEEYKKLRQYYSKEEATSKIRESFKDAFSNLSLSTQMEFDVNGVIKALEALNYKVVKGGKEAVDEVVAPLKAQQDIDVSVKGLNEIQKQLDDVFAGYELSVELEKMGLDNNLIGQLFNVDTFSLDDVQKNLNKLKPKLMEYGDEGYKVFSDMEKKITEMQQDELQERLKKYASYLKKSVAERVAIELEAQKGIAKVQATSELTPQQKEQVTKNIREEASKKKQEQTWKEFQDSDLYIRMFEDLESASTKSLELMEQKLLEYRDSLKSLDPSDLKEITNLLEKMREIKIDRNPFKGFVSNLKEVIKYQNQADELNKKYAESLSKQEYLSGLVESQELSIDSAQKRYNEQVKLNKAGSDEAINAKLVLSSQQRELESTRKLLEKQKEITTEYGKQISLGDKKTAQVNEQINKIGSYGSQAVNSLTELTDMLSNFGIDFGETFSGVVSGLGQAFQGLEQIDLTKPMSIITGAVSVVSGIGNAIASIFGAGDNKKEKEIQRQLKLVENLEYAYEKLEKAIDDAYSIDTYKKASDQAIANLEAQNEALQAAIAAESRKKGGGDKDRIKEWMQQMEDNEEAIAQLIKDQISTVTAGILDDGLAAADAFVDAWLEAFQETGDGLQGLEDNFNEMLLNMIKRQAAMSIVAPLIENMQKELEKYINKDDTDLTISEAEKFAEYVKNQLPEVSAALENLFNSLKDVGLEFGDAGDTMSSLQRGIQGITAEQSDALESLLNSVRFFTSDSNTVLHNIYNAITIPNVENPFLMELKVQSEQLRLLYGLFNGIIKNVSGSGRAMNVRIV